jgi:hypothetical protein
LRCGKDSNRLYLISQRKARRQKLKWLEYIGNDRKTTGVKRWRKKSEDRSAWAIILKETMVILEGPYVNEEEDTLKRSGRCCMKLISKVSNVSSFNALIKVG